MANEPIKQQVRQFYDQVGWHLAEDGHYQNARYEDLRPVSSEYIQRCHLRVTPYLKPGGKYLLDAGSGPVQYPEYLAYSREYDYRVCADISHTALVEARKRLGKHALCVTADVANLPFASSIYAGLVSLHTLHHLPLNEQDKAYSELYRVLIPGRRGVVVNGWTESALMRSTNWLVSGLERFKIWFARIRGKGSNPDADLERKGAGDGIPKGTFVEKMDSGWLKNHPGSRMNMEIRVWRSVNVRFLRAIVHPALAGKLFLRALFWLEDRFPRFMGEKGQYPLVIITKPEEGNENSG